LVRHKSQCTATGARGNVSAAKDAAKKRPVEKISCWGNRRSRPHWAAEVSILCLRSHRRTHLESPHNGRCLGRLGRRKNKNSSSFERKESGALRVSRRF